MIPVVKADGVSEQQLLSALRSRAGEVDKKVTESVAGILERVRLEGDAAVKYYTEKFDGAKLDASSVEVTEEEVEEAYRQVDEGLIDVIRKARANI